jgi:hypothetical protein
MRRYKGRTNARAIEKDFPHIVETVVPPGGLGKRLNEMTCTTFMLTNAQGVEHCRGTMVDFLAPLQPSQGEHNA